MYAPNVWFGLGFMQDKLMNFRFSRTHRTCVLGVEVSCWDWSWVRGSCKTNCSTSGSGVLTKPVVGVEVSSWDWDRG